MDGSHAAGEGRQLPKMSEGERTLLHAADVMRYYARHIERGWRHQALDHDQCLRAAARLAEIDVEALAGRDRMLLRQIADVLVCVEPSAYDHLARGLRQIAGPLVLSPPDGHDR